MKINRLNSKQIAFFLFSAVTLVLWQTSYKKHRGFCQEFISHPLSHQSLVYDVSDEALPLLHQKFRYLSCGRQAFVFESEDGGYVLKLLSSKRFLNGQKASILQKELESYLLAHKHLKSASGLIAMKIGKGCHLPIIELKDPWGLTRTCDLNHVDFILQKKAVTLAKFFKKHPLKIHEALTKVHNLLQARYEKNILDKDPRIHRNIGLTAEGPIFLDLGAFSYDQTVSQEDKQKELEKLLKYNQTYLKSQKLLPHEET